MVECGFGGKMLKFSPQNAKTGKLVGKRFAQKWLRNGRKVYSLDLLSGWACPFARDCKSKVVRIGGKSRIQDGPQCKFRCFSASGEVLYPPVYKLRKENWRQLLRAKSTDRMFRLLYSKLPKNAGIVRIHVGGDFFNRQYFDAWIALAYSRPDVLFYAYTKAIAFWQSRKDRIPSNLVLTASFGGIQDNLIEKNGFRSVKVVNRKCEARNLPIDESDSMAANPANQRNFALVLHGQQPAGLGARLVRRRK